MESWIKDVKVELITVWKSSNNNSPDSTEIESSILGAGSLGYMLLGKKQR